MFLKTSYLRTLPAVLLLSILAFASCKKDTDPIGLEILPPGEELGVTRTDTFSIIALTQEEDSARGDIKGTLQLLGSYSDPTFGVAKSSIYTQFILPSSDVDFGTSTQLDSVVLSLRTKGFYGKVKKYGGEQTIKVYKLTEDLPDTIYTNNTFAVDPTAIGELQFLPAPTDSIYLEGIKTTPQIRVRLSDDFGNALLNSSSLSDNETFLDEFKGLFITVENPNQAVGTGAIIYTELASAVSRVSLYYSNSTEDSLRFDFLINSDARWSELFEHDRTNATEITDQLGDSTLGQEKVYIQSMYSLKSKLYFPTLLNLPDKDKIVVNKAELVCTTLDDGHTTYFPPPAKLSLAYKDAEGTLKAVPDILKGETYFGGLLNSSKEYRFNLAFYVQDLLSGEIENNGLYLLNTGNLVNANRTAIQGPDTTNVSPMKLVLTYTKL